MGFSRSAETHSKQLIDQFSACLPCPSPWESEVCEILDDSVMKLNENPYGATIIRTDLPIGISKEIIADYQR